MGEADYSLVCSKHVESVLLWPERKATKNTQKFEMTLNPPKLGHDRTADASYFKWELSRESKMEKVRYRQEKTITPYQVTAKQSKRYLSTVNVNLVRDGDSLHLQEGHFKRGLEVKLS